MEIKPHSLELTFGRHPPLIMIFVAIRAHLFAIGMLNGLILMDSPTGAGWFESKVCLNFISGRVRPFLFKNSALKRSCWDFRLPGLGASEYRCEGVLPVTRLWFSFTYPVLTPWVYLNGVQVSIYKPWCNDSVFITQSGAKEISSNPS
ncbi:hypothetical protein AVEN_120429-1 [Araneus ventricosus]|uniref:Uncharacterized protein n=1 Tax=Araneus ventricosus TaxID=182803 RepID=A0A4Y2L8U2_ARAVE|nr:hypothetical protein AVEN_120429-1 [Araneus ventricosus]